MSITAVKPDDEFRTSSGTSSEHSHSTAVQFDEVADQGQANSQPPPFLLLSSLDSRQKGSKTRERPSGSMPIPESRIRSTTWVPSCCAVSSMLPPAGVYLTAFASRFILGQGRNEAFPVSRDSST